MNVFGSPWPSGFGQPTPVSSTGQKKPDVVADANLRRTGGIVRIEPTGRTIHRRHGSADPPGPDCGARCEVAPPGTNRPIRRGRAAG